MKSLNQYITEFVVKKHITSSYETVDLYLPSGLKWATCNIGAEKPEDPGLLFQWGRVDGYKYGDKNNKFLSKDDYVTASEKQYKVSDILDKSDDVAYQMTNGELRIPTEDEITELIKHTNNEWTELNGVKGMKFISKTDKFKWIFIPVSGYYNSYNNEFNHEASIWSATVNSYNHRGAGFLFYNSGSVKGSCKISYDNRSTGRSVRGVCK